ncbi:MAG: S46 family peptidase [Bacteroidetes bacterium]|nr:S46 family peptidase [Bacteroidota bacterium]
MIKKGIFLLFSLFLFNQNVVKADEGMWLPLLINRLNYVDMQKMGLKLTAEEIYSVNNSSIKDAIVSLNDGFCSAEMISKEGLLMTNHHCAYGFIQNHSTVEKDYLKNGFWAMSKMEELKNDKLTATFLIRMEDITQKILSQITPGMTENQRSTKIDEISSKLAAEATSNTTYTATVKSFFNGNEYYMFVYETYKDVRLVGAPPESIAAFADQADNWRWPRHAGDFAFFRIYMSPDGKPADYSKKNIPYVPKHFLPISTKGIKKDDFTMVLGYPATTDRFLSSYGVKMLLEQTNPSIVKIRGMKLDLMKADMDQSEDLRIKYASKYARTDNYWKYFTGQIQVLTKLNVIDKKQKTEEAFTKWVNETPKRKEIYGNVLNELSKTFEDLRKYNVSEVYYKEAINRGGEILNYAFQFKDLYNELKVGDNQEKINSLTQNLIYAAKQYFKSYNLETDKKITLALLEMYFEDVPKNQFPLIYEEVIQKKFKGDVKSFVNDMFEKSIFSSKDKVLEFLIKPDYKKIEKDPAYSTMVSFFEKHEEIVKPFNQAKLDLEEHTRLFIDGIMSLEKGKSFYPDANSTMRFSYGKVTDYNPTGQKNYNYYTTFEELMDRVDPNKQDFDVPEKLKELYRDRDFGTYVENGKVKVCFITNNDITGGTSGAPVLNGNGELVGLVFDINWEATSVSIAFEPELQRCINVDIRYILFLIEKYAGAGYLLNELSLKK